MNMGGVQGWVRQQEIDDLKPRFSPKRAKLMVGRGGEGQVVHFSASITLINCCCILDPPERPPSLQNLQALAHLAPCRAPGLPFNTFLVQLTSKIVVVFVGQSQSADVVDRQDSY